MLFTSFRPRFRPWLEAQLSFCYLPRRRAIRMEASIQQPPMESYSGAAKKEDTESKLKIGMQKKDVGDKAFKEGDTKAGQSKNRLLTLESLAQSRNTDHTYLVATTSSQIISRGQKALKVALQRTNSRHFCGLQAMLYVQGVDKSVLRFVSLWALHISAELTTHHHSPRQCRRPNREDRWLQREDRGEALCRCFHLWHPTAQARFIQADILLEKLQSNICGTLCLYACDHSWLMNTQPHTFSACHIKNENWKRAVETANQVR